MHHVRIFTEMMSRLIFVEQRYRSPLSLLAAYLLFLKYPRYSRLRSVFKVTVHNFIRVLTGRQDSATPRNKRLASDHQSNVLVSFSDDSYTFYVVANALASMHPQSPIIFLLKVYLTGHGGDSFIKFQDTDELANSEIAFAFRSMYEHNRYTQLFINCSLQPPNLRYNEILFIADTCRSASLYEHIDVPGVSLPKHFQCIGVSLSGALDFFVANARRELQLRH